MSKLWEPIRIGGMQLKNRLTMAPMYTCMASPGGEVSDEIVAYYERRAKGGAAMLVVEIAAVHPKGAVSDRELMACDDRYIPGLRRLAQAIRKHDCKAVLQLHHPGRQGDSRATGLETVGPSAVPWASFADVPRELTRAEVEGLIESYAEAARRTRDAGFDGVEFHGAHGYLICQFFSPLSNRRSDEYGGDVYKRAKFGVDIVKRARAKLGRDYPILFRISGSEIDEGGLTTEDTRIISKLLVDAGVDCIDVSAGYYGTSEWVSQPTFMKPGCIVKYAAEIKKSIQVPVITVGRIITPRLAESVLEEGAADIVALARPLLADPDYPRKAKEGRQGEIVKCIACNTCMDLVFLHKAIRCVQNPYAGYEREEGAEPRVERPKRVLVVGEGPAALEVARVSALRGHATTLWRTDNEAGRHWSWLMRGFVNDKVDAAAAAGARIEEKGEISLEDVRGLKPDAVLIEKAVSPVVPNIPGIDAGKVINASDVLSGRKELTGQIVILGGGNTGIQTALQLARKGARVTVIEARRGPAFEIEQIGRKVLVRMLNDLGARMLFRCSAAAIDGGGVRYVNQDGKGATLNADHVVLALGVKTTPGLEERISGQGYRTIALDPCSSQRTVYDSVRQGTLAARGI